MQTTGISTPTRYLYLNFYAFLLAFGGIGVACSPVYKLSPWLIIAQAAAVLCCWKNAYKIFHSWNDKKRKYKLLMERNSLGIRPDTFTDYMQAPCGRLLVKVVLKDLGQQPAWQELRQLRHPLRQRLREGCQPQRTTVHIINNNT